MVRPHAAGRVFTTSPDLPLEPDPRPHGSSSISAQGDHVLDTTPVQLPPPVEVVPTSTPVLVPKAKPRPAAVAPASAPAAVPVQTETGSEGKGNKAKAITVYTTRTGEKYHRASCSSLRKSQRPMELSEAQAMGYGPCGRCKPPR